MRTVHMLLVLATLAGSAVAAPPKNLWDLDFAAAKYSLHPHGTTGPSTSFAETQKAIETQVKRGEWIIHTRTTGVPPEAELAELTKRAKKIGAVVVADGEAVTGTIPNVKGPYSRGGMLRKVNVSLVNKSPYKLRVTALHFVGCSATASVPLTTAVELAPNGRARREVRVAPSQIESPEAALAVCTPDDGWMPTVGATFEVS